MNLEECTAKLLQEIKVALGGLSEAKLTQLTNEVMAAPQIFVAGAGRSGLMMKSFAMRLMHLGFAAHVVGETTTPGIAPGDLLLIGSGSGATESLVVMAAKAQRLGAKVAVITILADSPLGQAADYVITIAAPTPKIKGETGFQSIQPMGSLFEQSLLLTLDLMIMFLMAGCQKDSATMFQRHANLE